MNGPLHGLLAEFDEARELLRAAREARRAGFRRLDAYSPFPVHGLDEVLGLRRSRLPRLVLAAGLLGGLGGFFLQWYAMAVDYPVVAGGKPLNSWPAFIPIAFELTVLAAALAVVLGVLWRCGFPEPYHPVFHVEAFERASRDRFFLCIESSDPAFDPAATRRFLKGLGPRDVFEVPR